MYWPRRVEPMWAGIPAAGLLIIAGLPRLPLWGVILLGEVLMGAIVLAAVLSLMLFVMDWIASQMNQGASESVGPERSA